VHHLSSVEIIVRLVVAALLGSTIGFERERLLWAAGLRTHMLVCVGAALVIIVSAFGFEDILGHANVTLDPSRVAAQVVSGIGFLGAGTIILRQDIIRGLTTAASLWTVAGIGLAVGGGLYLPATAATILILGILFGLKPLEKRLNASRRNLGALSVEIDPMRISRAAIEATIARGNARIMHADTVATPDGARRVVQMIVTTYSRVELDQLEQTVRALNGVETVTMNRI